MTINTCIPNSSATKTITNNNYANITTNTNTTSTNDIVPIQSDADRRTFRRVVAPNGIECLFVKDVHSKTLAASCCVGSGASSDPYEFPGLAHFCEHMVRNSSSRIYIYLFFISVVVLIIDMTFNQGTNGTQHPLLFLKTIT